METFEDGYRIYTHPVPSDGGHWLSVTDARGVAFGRVLTRVTDKTRTGEIEKAKAQIANWRKTMGID